MISAIPELPPEPTPDSAFLGGGPYALSYLDWAGAEAERRPDAAARVLALGGKGQNEFADLCHFLPVEMDVVLLHDAPIGADALESQLDGVQRVFILAGLGGGRGTAMALKLARAARDRGIPVFALVSLPFDFEGTVRIARANAANAELQAITTACLNLRNQDLIELLGGQTGLVSAFSTHTRWLAHAVASLEHWVRLDGLRHVSAAAGQGMCLRMGYGRGSGVDRVGRAVSAAADNPLLRAQGAGRCLLLLASGERPTDAELQAAAGKVSATLNACHELTLHAYADARMGTAIYATLLLTEAAPS